MKYIKILGNENLYEDVMETLNNLEKNDEFFFGGAINMHAEASQVLNACLLNYVIWYYNLADEDENQDSWVSDLILQKIYDYAETVPKSEELLKTIEENGEIERKIKELWGDKEE